MISPVVFWTVAILTVIPALALLFARKAVHIAMSVVAVMVGLAIAYVALDAPFLGVVQIVVYTGAVMMLFLFVLMLVGVDRRESLKDTIAGQKWIGLALALGVAVLLIRVVQRTFFVTQAPANSDPEFIAGALFGKYVLVMEALAFVLIAAAVGALVLTFVPRLAPRVTQKELHAARLRAGADPVNKPMPGLFARHNALDAPALDPYGQPIEDSVSRVLEARRQTKDGEEFRHQVEGVRRDLGLSTPDIAVADADAGSEDPARREIHKEGGK